ncbi:uncharacterized protein LOC132753723 isoform X2 [Ruditapes philippinarum]|uniref:uncharacterized protein LOC132753723 isoform X2 n=1 Tax=Ruditapes philippinarum TaxID=129788 RepID=UPI00295A6D28|nr:uncharacterized protein LOC132753723 isoform X2 [Ruditapes philippinarum]
MASYSPKLLEKKYNNWVKAQLAVLFTKEGVEPFVCNEMQQFQLKCLHDIWYLNGLFSGTCCSSCCTENVVHCPTDTICKVKHGKCTYHRNVATRYSSSGCPNKICHNFKTEIHNAHRYKGPSYKNSDATQWCSNYWEVAKCFMPPDGYREKTSATETDFNGIISVILNYKDFQGKIRENLNNKKNIFEEARVIGRNMRHSSKLEVEDSDLQNYFQLLQKLLSDPAYLGTDTHAQNAKQKLIQLENDTLVIGKNDIRKVLDDVATVIQDKMKAGLDDQYDRIKLEMIRKEQEDLLSLESKTAVGMTKIQDKTDALVKRLNEQGAKERTGLTELGETLQKELKTASKAEKGEQYIDSKQQLQGDLIKFYRQRCSSIPLSPLLEEIETPLAGFYVMPDLVAVKQKSLTCHEEERTPIKSLKDLFSTGSGDQQAIYLSADAGFGKTAFSKYLAITWCQAHCRDENYACFKDDELKTLFDFKFLFLVLLRDCTSVCNIDDMIEQQITKKLRPSASLDEVLRREKCLIILDGLDEWTHPDNSCGEVTEKIPHRYVPDNCVILTTTRPWKLGVSNLKTSQINKKVELVQLSADSTRQLEENAIRKMTGVHNDRVLKSKRQDFNKVIRDRRLEHMQVIPLLLMYIVCLWCNNIPIGNSKHEIYTNIIEFLLSRTSKKHPEVQPSCESSASEIPEYFKSHEFCKKFYSLIISLAELAYQTLFNENRENTLVFDRTVAEKYLKADDMKLSLLSGILSESRSKTLIKEIIKVSFSHKTVQEFFAAIFISSQSDAQKTVVEKCRTVQDILDMSKICEFISGMNADRMCEISNDLMSVINEDEKTRDYRTRTGDENMYNTPLYNIQKMFMSCLQEMPESENIQLCLQDFFIKEDTVHSKQLQRLLKQNKTNIKSLYIDIRDTSSSLREIIDLFSLTDLSHIQKLYYSGDEEKEAQISRILFPSLQSVTLLFGTWTNDEENLSENMARCQNLQYLYIYNFTLSHKILETIFNFISGQKSMKELTLMELHCKEHGRHDCKRLNLDLSQHSTLSELYLQLLPGRLQLNISTPSLVNVELWDINLDESSLLLSRDMLNIERVVLREIEMSAGSLQNFIIVLENLPQSVTVKMKDIKPETEYDSVRENIRRSQTFHVIDDWRLV